MSKKEIAATFKYAGAFIAWLIGSGFATGQEILQFFSSYGKNSIWILAVCLIGFSAMGVIIVAAGYNHRKSVDFNHYEYFCGRYIGKFYSVFVPVILAMIMAVLISGAGATLEQFYSVNRFIGSTVMAALVLAVYLIGFEGMVKIVSAVSPFVIIFTLVIGVYAFIKGLGSSDLIKQAAALEKMQPAKHWSISALLYLSLNFLSGSVYYTMLGHSALSKRSAVTGALIGAVSVIAAITFIAVSIIFNGNGIAAAAVPTLFLAKEISPVFGSAFSIILMLGMFASSTTTLWSFCSGFFKKANLKISFSPLLR